MCSGKVSQLGYHACRDWGGCSDSADAPTLPCKIVCRQQAVCNGWTAAAAACCRTKHAATTHTACSLGMPSIEPGATIVLAVLCDLQTAMIEVTPVRPLPLEVFTDLKALGRVALREGGRTVAVGIVTQIQE